MIRTFLAVLSIMVFQAQYAPSEDAGISFFQDGDLRSGERIRFLAEGGAGWDQMPIHVGPLDRGMYGFPLYDQHLSPGGSLTVETSLMRRGTSIAHITMNLPIDADRRYFVHAAVQPTNPAHGCMGCMGLRSVKIPGDRSCRLWVYYAFNGISGPIMF